MRDLWDLEREASTMPTLDKEVLSDGQLCIEMGVDTDKSEASGCKRKDGTYERVEETEVGLKQTALTGASRGLELVYCCSVHRVWVTGTFGRSGYQGDGIPRRAVVRERRRLERRRKMVGAIMDKLTWKTTISSMLCSST
ncbi:hypothetical protein NDU88_005338 [Pleurodeles waltl]|uniref:Uncharacterized protein n=1 Tax=Pleurodeles waltl TaxID=8319 RepID=A0AAV7TAQ5_PLEWA|nr:hypothetical protein NDU88_005338 [Pleurodeles waltl]